LCLFILLLTRGFSLGFSVMVVGAEGGEETALWRGYSKEARSTHPRPYGYSLTAPIEWNKTYGGVDRDSARYVRQTSDGGYIVAGATRSFGTGVADFWLFKIDGYGNVDWNKTFGGSELDAARSVQQTSDGGYIAVGVTYSFGDWLYGDCWLIKTDANGNMVWNKTYGGSSWEDALSVQQTSEGGYIIAGYTASFGAGSTDYWLIKTDANGDMVWNETYGGDEADQAYCVQQTSNGGYVMVGNADSFNTGVFEGEIWLVKTDAYGNVSWSWLSGWPDWDFAQSAQQTSDGGYIIAGTRFSSYDTRYDFWLIKIDANGTLEWDGVYARPGTNEDVAYSVQQTVDGGYIVAGGWGDFWIVKTDASGNMEWNKSFGGAESENAYCVKQTNDGGYIAAGLTESFGFGRVGSPDAWLVKFFPFHDVAVTEVSPASDHVPAGFNLNISVTVENHGDFVEAFNVTACANGTVVGEQEATLASGESAILPFSWNTSGFSLGNYTISAYAAPVANETKTDDNTYVDGVVTVRMPIHDVAVTNVTLPKTVVGKGYSMAINVTVENQGDYTETFNVTVSINQTRTLTLPPGSQVTIVFAWNTIGVLYGNYTVSAYATTVPGESEVVDNTLVDGWVFMTIPGDMDGDRDVDIYDIVSMCGVYGTSQSDPDYDPCCDMDNDGDIDIYDIVIAADNYGENW